MYVHNHTINAQNNIWTMEPSFSGIFISVSGGYDLRVNQCDKTKVVDVASKMLILIINHFKWYKNSYILSFSLNVSEGKILDLFIQSSFLKFSSLIAIQIKILILNIFLEQNEN